MRAGRETVKYRAPPPSPGRIAVQTNPVQRRRPCRDGMGNRPVMVEAAGVAGSTATANKQGVDPASPQWFIFGGSGGFQPPNSSPANSWQHSSFATTPKCSTIELRLEVSISFERQMPFAPDLSTHRLADCSPLPSPPVSHPPAHAPTAPVHDGSRRRQRSPVARRPSCSNQSSSYMSTSAMTSIDCCSFPHAIRPLQQTTVFPAHRIAYGETMRYRVSPKGD
jgi:hypothetical protein